MEKLLRCKAMYFVSYRRSACSAWAPGVRARRRVRGVVPAWRRIPRRRRHHPSVNTRLARSTSTAPLEAAASQLPLSSTNEPPAPGGRRRPFPSYFGRLWLIARTAQSEWRLRIAACEANPAQAYVHFLYPTKIYGVTSLDNFNFIFSHNRIIKTII